MALCTMTQRSVIVTGASSGIGLELAVHLAENGFRTYATMRDLARRDALDAEAARRQVSSLRVLPLDVTQPDSIAQVVQTVAEECGRVDAVVNNAGAQIRGFFEDVPEEELRQIFEVNLLGAMAMTRAVLPGMREAGAGRLIFVSSVGGRIGSPSLTAYCASKFGLEGFGEALALEVAPLGIQVSVVAPPIVNTEIWRRNRGVAQAALDPHSPYFPWFQRNEALADRLVASATVTAGDVARTVHRLLCATRPRRRVVIGWRARALLGVSRLLPEPWFERLYAAAVRRVLDPNKASSRSGALP